MPKIDDHSYLKICADLASCLSISLAAARRKVELAVAKKGLQGLDERKAMAELLLKKALKQCADGVETSASQFDSLLSALEEEENFMTED